VLSETKWKLDSVLRFLVGVLMCLCLGSLLTLLLRGATAPDAAPSVGRILTSALVFQAGIIALAWRFLYEHQVGWVMGFGWHRNPGKAIGWGLVATGIFLPLAWGLQTASLRLLEALGIESSLQLALQALKSSGSAGELAALAVVTIILAPVAEETLFRGILYPTIKQYGFPRAALWGTSALFALIHFNFAIFIPLLLLALVLVWLYEKTDNLLAPIAAHVAFNAVNFVLFILAGDFAHTPPASS
jgi:membrane protease YdiL (CAAX protease family)